MLVDFALDAVGKPVPGTLEVRLDRALGLLLAAFEDSVEQTAEDAARCDRRSRPAVGGRWREVR